MQIFEKNNDFYKVFHFSEKYGYAYRLAHKRLHLNIFKSLSSLRYEKNNTENTTNQCKLQTDTN